MTVGIPSISTYCGSVCEFIQEGVTGWIYRYEEYEMLAYKILKLFNDDESAIKVGKACREEMLQLKQNNKDSLIDIYKEILSEDNISYVNK